MYWFAVASLTPAILLMAASLLGGVWPWVALLYVTGFVFLADRLGHVTYAPREDGDAERFARRLAIVLALVHFCVLIFAVRAIATAPYLGWGQALALGLAAGMFMGQVSNSNAHEMIHAPARLPRVLGTAVYISLLFGHHVSAHTRVHHAHVATPKDPNSARPGEGFYRFWPRAWIGSFREGWRAETAARARMAHPPAAFSHPYVGYCGGAVVALMLAYLLAGWPGVAVFVAITGYAQMQLLLADYVQHYGLARAQHPDGRPVQAGPQHSWNAAPWFSAAMMLNAPRHSDHHMHPMRLFPALRLDRATMPVLPWSLPVMAAIALLPPLWRRVMDPRVARLNAGGTGKGAGAGAGRADLPLSDHAHDPVDSSDPDRVPGDGTNADVRRGI